MALSLKEALARRGVPKAASSARFGTPIRLRLRMNAEIDRPVDVARLLVSQGVSLKRAHAFLQRIAAGDTVAAQMWSEDSGALVARFSDLGIEAVELRIPDVSPKEIRTRMNLSQADFATAFGFELDTVQNWDQGRNRPDASARILLAIIARHPSIVEAVLAERDDTGVEPH
ncbi:hypothetical protein IPV08_13215 [Methylobacterium sp. SD274]|uniref:helix-turn-helix domain-containing protein n=1 Tax=Methylobacterium sp. SD274 TaxID=2782009 RepID=UPI001A96EB52|nr:hypothetical protein [Methylobacterium sp. SD274]MBO1020929.1 hypothetical protein [Methylobacterium sp. SD274]